MVRSVGITAVVLTLAWTGLAGAQPSSPSATAVPQARYIIVNEDGGRPQRCKVLKMWQDANGAPAFQVQAVDSGEMMTIVGAGPHGSGGDPREMSTRIFRWGSDNKPPAGAPIAPPTAVESPARPIPAAPGQPSAPVATPQPSWPSIKPSPSTVQTPQIIQPTPKPATPVVVKSQPIRLPPQPSASAQVVTTPQLPPSPPSLPKPMIITAPTSKQTPTVLTSTPSTKPVPSFLTSQPKPSISDKTPALTPMSTPVIQYGTKPTSTSNGSTSAPNAAAQPRLLPTACDSGSPKTSCACPSPCTTCGQPCASCSQSSCVSCTPSPLRQKFMSRVFKSNAPCACTEAACQPTPAPMPKPTTVTPVATTVVKAPTEPAKPSDWRESWGKVEPWKGTAQAASVKPEIELTKRADPPPVRIEPPTQPDPLKAPDQYRDLAMQARPSNSKIPEDNRLVVAPKQKTRIFSVKRPSEPLPPARPVEEVVVVNSGPAPTGAMPSAPPAAQPQGRAIQLAADEPNAFWSPPQSNKPEDGRQTTAKFNAFDRESDNPPPQGTPPRMNGDPQTPRSPRPMAMITPPRGPMPMLPQPAPMPPMRYDMGVPDALGNAFTLPGTRRPIPADFGGTPQEPNGFDPMVRAGQGSPPQAYTMGGMPGMARPPMSNMMAMGPQGPMGMNPLMSVPPTPNDPRLAAATQPSAPTASVPEMLATLKDSLCPSEREAVAEKLSELNWRIQPLVVDCLMKAAREDPAATVRAACVHALAHMQVDTPESVALVRELKADRDPRVRQEAEEALSAFGDSGIQQASHK